MDRGEARALRVALEMALSNVGKEFNMDIKVKSISYSKDDFHCKIEGLTCGAESLEAQYYRRVASEDMPMLGSKILLQGTEYTVLGWKSRASKYPIIIADNTGHRYKISTRQLVSATVLD